MQENKEHRVQGRRTRDTGFQVGEQGHRVPVRRTRQGYRVQCRRTKDHWTIGFQVGEHGSQGSGMENKEHRVPDRRTRTTGFQLVEQGPKGSKVGEQGTTTHRNTPCFEKHFKFCFNLCLFI